MSKRRNGAIHDGAVREPAERTVAIEASVVEAPSSDERDIDVSVIVVTHNSGAVLQESLASVLAQSPGIELIVVDNASDDASLVPFLPQDPRLTLERNPDNRGFSRACNQGARLARGRHVMFLNPDCRLAPDALPRLLARCRDDALLGVIGAPLMNADGSPQAAARRQTPTPMRALRRALGLRRDAIEMPAVSTHPDDPAVIEFVDAVSGALMLLPRAAFERLGGFDEDYVLHCEDLDLCRRALLDGYRVAVAHDVKAVHLKGTSSRRRPLWVEWQKHRGMLRYFRKFDAAASPWWLRLAVPLGVWLRFPLAALRAWGRAAVQR